MEWSLFYELHWHKRFEPLFFYLAQIALEVVRANARPGANFTLDDFLFKFDAPKPLSKEAATAYAKAKWYGLTGAKDPNNPEQPQEKLIVRRAPSEEERKRMQEEARKQWQQRQRSTG